MSEKRHAKFKAGSTAQNHNASESGRSAHPAEAWSVRSRSCISQVWSSTWYAV